MNWDKVVIADIWGPGRSHLAAPNGKDLTFTLVSRKHANNNSVSEYLVTFNPGEAPDEWAGAIFKPMGNDKVTGISGLPDWDPSKPPGVCQAYQAAIDNTQRNNLGSGSTERLEAVIPYVDASGALGFNYVRLFYVDNVRNKPTKHLHVIKAVAASLPKGSVRALQDGAGHGPPS